MFTVNFSFSLMSYCFGPSFSPLDESFLISLSFCPPFCLKNPLIFCGGVDSIHCAGEGMRDGEGWNEDLFSVLKKHTDFWG